MVETKNKIKVKAGETFHYYRNQVLGLPVKDFRALQDAKEVLVDKSIVDKYLEAFDWDGKEKEPKPYGIYNNKTYDEAVKKLDNDEITEEDFQALAEGKGEIKDGN